MTKPVNYLNHVAFILDGSGSMTGLKNDVIRVFDKQVAQLRELSKNSGQEVRLTVYIFDNVVENVIFDMDVLRVPSLKDLYWVRGSTALIDATLQGIKDLKQTCQLYADHAFLLYVLTDGDNNVNNHKSNDLLKTIETLPDNWTVAAFVPSQSSKFTIEKFGFPKQNIAVWSTTSDGMDDVGDIITKATTSYIQNRSVGIRSSKNLFSLNTAQLNDSAVKNKLTELKSSEYSLLPVGKESPIKDFVIGFTKDYIPGSAYYQLTKSEKIQASKQICVQDKKNGKIYTGQNARDLLGLPNYEVKVCPIQHDKYNIYVQSLSVNRKLMSGTNLLVMK